MDGSIAPPIRILIAGLPAALADIIAGLVATEADMAIIGQTGSVEETIAALPGLRPDLLILCVAEPAAPVIAAADGARVLAIAGQGTDGELVELHPRSSHLGELSAAGLLAAIRGG